MTTLKIHLLGPPLVEHAPEAAPKDVAESDHRSVEISRRRSQALLFYLALAEKPQPRATLTTLLWPESDEQSAHASLRRHLSELNGALGGGWISAGPAGVTLARSTNLWVDLLAFQQLLAACQRHDHAPNNLCPTCIDALTRAVSLYRGDFLAGFTLPDAPAFDEWQFFQGEEARQSVAIALEKLVQAHAGQGEQALAISYARRLLSLDPLHEPTHRTLMQLYAENGQQSAAVRQYELCLQSLREELGVAPAAETVALYEQIRQGSKSALPKPVQSERSQEPPLRHNLPAATTAFIGRVKERAALTRLCRDEGRRLITILGPGGIGKTRLALEVAAQLLDSTADGIYFVRLAQLDDASNIIPTIATTLNFSFAIDGRTPKQQLFEYLQPKQILLVLDNFEHLLEGVPLLQELLQSSPGLRLLVTSRERLQLMSETLYTLSNLAFPADDGRLPPKGVEIGTSETGISETGAYEAVDLFIETAQRVRARSRATPQPPSAQELGAIAEVCRLVGGMPLGIILAASWVEVLSPQEIAAELAKGFDLLASELHDLPARQQSMRAVLTYSWQRLTAAEQAVLMRLSLCRGGFTRAAAEKIAGASLAVLARLVNKSFVQQAGEPRSHETQVLETRPQETRAQETRAQETRYDIHELVRQFAEEQLEVAALRPAMQETHGLYYLELLYQCEARMAGPEQVEAILQLEADFENVRAAWLWAVQMRNYEAVDRSLDALFHWFFWLRRNRQQEGLALLRIAHQQWGSLQESAEENAPSAHPVWGRIQARLLEQQGPWLDNPFETKARLEESLRLAQQWAKQATNQEAQQAEILFCQWALALAIVSDQALFVRTTNIQPAFDIFRRCLDAYRASGDDFWLGQTLEKLGHAYRRDNECEVAAPLIQESLALRQRQGDRFGIARSLRELAWVRFTQGMEKETFEAAQDAYELQIALNDQQGIADSRFFLALCLLCRGDWQGAKDLLIPVRQLSLEIKSTLYQRWSSIAYTVATQMEESVRLHSSVDDSSLGHPSGTPFPNRFNAFTTRFFYALFSWHTTPSYVGNLEKLFLLAASEEERAFCMLLAAELLGRVKEYPGAVGPLALAMCYPEIERSWAMQIPEIAQLQAELRTHVLPTEFAKLWEEGRALDLQAAMREVERSVLPRIAQASEVISRTN